MRMQSKLVGGVSLILVVLIVFFFNTIFIPPILGRVVDAVTGNPVRGVNIALSESHYVGWSIDSKITRKTSTNRFGWFFFLPAFRWMPGGLLSEFRAYTLILNEGSVGMIGRDEASAEIAFSAAPTNRSGWAVANENYFPLSVTFQKSQCAGGYAGTCAYKSVPFPITIRLIPALANVADCTAISDSSLRESCRQMNTYRSALLHVSTYDEVQEDKQLCEQVDHGLMSRSCLSALEGAARTPASAVQPVPAGMFPDSLAGVPVMQKRCGPRLLFSGRVLCAAGYGVSVSNEMAAVYIETFPGAHENLQASQWRPTYNDYRQATVTAEKRLGSKILCYHGPMYDSYLWYSGEKRIEVFFYHHIPQESQFLSYYLAHFPSTLQ